MKSFTATLLSVFFLAGVSSSLAGVAKKTYSGSYKGQPCTVKITWYNWDGLGPISGVIQTSSGAMLTFSGSNSQPGVIELTAAGESFRLVRRDVGKAASWTGSRLSFSEGAAPTPTPSPTPSPSPTTETLIPESEVSASQIVDETYTGTWRGQEITARIRWAPGDETGSVRRGRGTMTLAGGQQLSIEGWQRSPEEREFSIKPNETGETYKTTKTTRTGIDSWESNSLILIEKK